jgi:EAL domain-containing protein (putative c-di-GMP-specific phosphodiesterase class I)
VLVARYSAEEGLASYLTAPPVVVFVNREPAALDRPMSPELAAAIYRDLPFAIVVEFTERALATAPAALLRATDAVHGFGNAAALGAGWGQGWLFGRPGPLAAIAGRPVESPPSLRRVDFPSADHSADSAFEPAGRGSSRRPADDRRHGRPGAG